jgi:uncharacterized protein DUF5681
MADSDDAVGYRKPPRHNRFQKGRSGNPHGRPKGAKNLATLLGESISEQVIVNENGRRRSISKLEAAVKQLVNRAAAGDPKQMQQLFSLTQWVEGRAEALAPTTESLTEADREVIQQIYARLKHRDNGDGHG